MTTETTTHKPSPRRAPARASARAQTQTAAAPAAAVPSVFEFQDYRKFLASWFEFKKRVQPGYSGALFARKAGLQSHTLLGMVIRGQRNLSYSGLRSFARALGLKARELRYFESLVLFNQAKSGDDKAYHLEQLRAAAPAGGEIVTRIAGYAEYFSHWYVVAIREMVHLADFQNDPQWIARRLKGKITPKQAADSIKLLLGLKLVEQDEATSRLRVLTPCIDVEPGMIDFAIRNFHKQYLERAHDAIEGEPLSERELSSLTLSLNDEQLARLKTRLGEFRRQLNLEFGGATDRAHVVAVNMQALTLTTTHDHAKKEITP